MNKKEIQALYHYVDGYKGYLLMSLGTMFIELLVSFMTPLVLSVFIDNILNQQPLHVVFYFEALIKALGDVDYIRDHLWMMGLLYVALRSIGGLMTFIRAWANNRASEGAMKRLRDQLYQHIQYLPYDYHVKCQTGDLIQRATNDIETIRRFIAGSSVEFVRTLILTVCGMFLMMGIHLPLTLIAFSLVPFLLFTSLYFFKKIQRYYGVVEEREGRVFTIIQENLTGNRVVRAFARQRYEVDKFNEENEQLRLETISLDNLFASLWGSLDLISGIQISLVSILGVYYVLQGSLSLGQFTAFSSYVYTFLFPIRSFGRVLSDFGRTLISVHRIEEIMNEKEEEGLFEGLQPSLKGDIVFENVSFQYDDVKVFDHLNMTIPQGKTIAILGGTGSGKSTLILLLQRLYDIQEGRITINGYDITEMNKLYLRKRMSMVLQEPFLYSKTILENIRITSPQSSMDRVIEASKMAHIHDDILSFEQGYHTVVGERGVTLSGGQKQRVAIARALMEESDVLIFDDSLSAVDTRTDAAIREDLKHKKQDVTTIIISHRITTLMEADYIFVLKDGHVVEEGCHEDLLKQKGLYYETYLIQSSVAQ